MELSQVDPQVFVSACPGLSIGPHLKTGGQKRVWRCAYEGAAYVLKAILGNARALRRVEREMQIMRECMSPYLPTLGPLGLRTVTVESGETILYFLEEYIDGIPLASAQIPMPATQLI